MLFSAMQSNRLNVCVCVYENVGPMFSFQLSAVSDFDMNLH